MDVTANVDVPVSAENYSNIFPISRIMNHGLRWCTASRQLVKMWLVKATQKLGRLNFVHDLDHLQDRSAFEWFARVVRRRIVWCLNAPKMTGVAIRHGCLVQQSLKLVTGLRYRRICTIRDLCLLAVC